MRDVFAGVLAIVLLFIAVSLATALHGYRRRRQRARDEERALGRAVIVEIPGAGDLVLFSEDAVRFHYGERSIDKDLIVGVRMLINGVAIAEATRVGTDRACGGEPSVVPGPGTSRVSEPDDGIARDRWTVEIETINRTTLIECGAIRERVSQELARTVFDAVKRDVERRHDRPVTIRAPGSHHDD